MSDNSNVIEFKPRKSPEKEERMTAAEFVEECKKNLPEEDYRDVLCGIIDIEIFGRIREDLRDIVLKITSLQHNVDMPQGFQSDLVQIQVQDSTGNWLTYGLVENDPQRILSEMQHLSQTHCGARVRAIDSSGRIVEIL